jgi:hypothetical protein
VPLLASVCPEAREVVFEWGQHQVSQDCTSLASIWLQPKIDRALHLNWTRRRNEAFSMSYNTYYPSFEDNTVNMLIYRAHWDYDMRVSLAGEVFYPFDLGELMGSPPPFDTDSVASGTPSMPAGDAYQDERAEDLRTIIDIVDIVDDKTIYATVVAISLHVDRAAALASGLFGLLTDAPVQTVDYDDVLQLRQFYELFSSDPALKEAEPHAEKLFNAILSPAFHAAVRSWQKNVRWLLQVAAWKYMQIGETLKTFGDTDPRSVWTPPVPKEQYSMRMDQFMPNEDHPWWGEYAERLLPKVVPQVMVRLCDNQCYREERRPEMFGEVGFTKRYTPSR